MNEDYNPYAQQPSADNPYANPQNTEPQYQQYPQQPQYPQYPQYPQQAQYPQQPPQYQQYQQSQPYQQQQQMPQQPYPYQQQYYYNQRPQGNKSAGMAKAFSIVSFITGCISILIVLMFAFMILLSIATSTYKNGISSWVNESLPGLSVRDVVMIALPGIIFGIVALAKKTKLTVLAVMGVVFNGVLLLSTVLFSLTNI